MKSMLPILALALTAAASLQAQTPSPRPTIDAAERRAVVGRVAQLMTENYVFPDVAVKSGDEIKRLLAAGAFDSITDPALFADRLTRALREVNHDKHVGVHVRDGRPGGPTPEDDFGRNYGVQRVEHLAGNVGYLDLRGFAPVNLARPNVIAAMQLLANSDAVILDLRRNGGGDPNTVRLLASYFFGKPTHLNDLYWRRGERTEEFWTLDSIPGKRLADVPVYVLTSKSTFSGGEEFTYDMQTQKRATIIGETTGGGANPGGMQPVNEHFDIFIPMGTAINPITKKNWEGTGVTPDVAVAADVALDTALARARVTAKVRRDAEQQKAAAIRNEVQQSLPKGDAPIAAALQKALTTGVFDEGSINMLGYQQLQLGKIAQAIAIFKFNVAVFPASPNVYDSLGEAYMNAGQKDLAILNYRKSLELDPTNQNAVDMIKKMSSR